MKNCDRDLIRAGAMVGGDQRRLLRFIVVPAALPSIFAGLRIGIGSAWMLTVTAELVAVKSGLGYVLWDSYYFLRHDLVIELVGIWQKHAGTIVFVTHSVDEALTLGAHTAVMTARPGRIRELIPIDLPRPRDITSPQFNDSERHILSLLRTGQADAST